MKKLSKILFITAIGLFVTASIFAQERRGRGGVAGDPQSKGQTAASMKAKQAGNELTAPCDMDALLKIVKDGQKLVLTDVDKKKESDVMVSVDKAGAVTFKTQAVRSMSKTPKKLSNQMQDAAMASKAPKSGIKNEKTVEQLHMKKTKGGKTELTTVDGKPVGNFMIDSPKKGLMKVNCKK